jgi:hypothetical protein
MCVRRVTRPSGCGAQAASDCRRPYAARPRASRSRRAPDGSGAVLTRPNLNPSFAANCAGWRSSHVWTVGPDPQFSQLLIDAQ